MCFWRKFYWVSPGIFASQLVVCCNITNTFKYSTKSDSDPNVTLKKTHRKEIAHASISFFFLVKITENKKKILFWPVLHSCNPIIVPISGLQIPQNLCRFRAMLDLFGSNYPLIWKKIKKKFVKLLKNGPETDKQTNKNKFSKNPKK